MHFLHVTNQRFFYLSPRMPGTDAIPPPCNRRLAPWSQIDDYERLTHILLDAVPPALRRLSIHSSV